MTSLNPWCEEPRFLPLLRPRVSRPPCDAAPRIRSLFLTWGSSVGREEVPMGARRRRRVCSRPQHQVFLAASPIQPGVGRRFATLRHATSIDGAAEDTATRLPSRGLEALPGQRGRGKDHGVNPRGTDTTSKQENGNNPTGPRRAASPFVMKIMRPGACAVHEKCATNNAAALRILSSWRPCLSCRSGRPLRMLAM